MAQAMTEGYPHLAIEITTFARISNKNAEVPVTAIWDTGSMMTSISSRVIKKLSLVKTGEITVQTPIGRGIKNTYIVDVLLSGGIHIKDLRVSESDFGNKNADMLIGMDIITRGDFIITNYNNRSVFSFRIPSEGHVDYFEENIKTELKKSKEAPNEQET